MPYTLIKSQVVTIAGTSAKFTNAMQRGEQYRFSATTDCWVLVGATGGSAAAATANNHFVAKGQTIYLACDNATNGFVHVIQDSVGGYGTLSLVETV